VSRRGGRGPAGGVMVSRKNDDRRLKSLGAMDRHHANLVALDFHVAFDLSARLADPGQEALQRRGFMSLVVQSKIEEFVQRIVGFETKPRQEAPPSAIGAQHAGEEHKRRLAPRRKSQRLQPRIGLIESLAGMFRERRAQSLAAAVRGDIKTTPDR